MNQIDLDKISIGYISTQDPNDKRSWSSTHYHLLHSLQTYFPGTQALGPVRLPLYQKAIIKFYDGILGKLSLKYNRGFSRLKMALYSTCFEKQIGNGEFDILFCSACSTALAKLNTKLPVVYLSDTTFSALVNYYVEFTDLPRLAAYEGNLAEELSIRHANLILYSSHWAKRHAVEDYGACPEKIEVFPYGANILVDSGEEPTKIKIDNQGSTCRLLFLAREWERKGGDVVLETVAELLDRGYSVELTVVGCGMSKLESSKHIQVFKFLDKNIQQDCEKFEEIMATCHFLFLPTLADCTPMVFAEANAYGMPVITRDTGGVSTIVKNDINGYILPNEASALDFARLIEQKFFRSKEYLELAKQSRKYYTSNLSWNVWALNAKEAIVRAFYNNG